MMTDTVILDRSFTRDPHDILHQLQSQAPAVRAVMWGDVPVWLVTRYDDAKSLLADPRLVTDRAIALKFCHRTTTGNTRARSVSTCCTAARPITPGYAS